MRVATFGSTGPSSSSTTWALGDDRTDNGRLAPGEDRAEVGEDATDKGRLAAGENRAELEQEAPESCMARQTRANKPRVPHTRANS